MTSLVCSAPAWVPLLVTTDIPDGVLLIYLQLSKHLLISPLYKTKLSACIMVIQEDTSHEWQLLFRKSLGCGLLLFRAVVFLTRHRAVTRKLKRTGNRLLHGDITWTKQTGRLVDGYSSICRFGNRRKVWVTVDILPHLLHFIFRMRVFLHEWLVAIFCCWDMIFS